MRGFSLIELMVVIAVVAILSAVAVPLYKDYLIRTKISAAMITMNAVAKEAVEKYHRNGTWANRILLHGLPINESWQVIDKGNVYAVGYSGDTNVAFIQMTVSGLEGIPGYLEPSADPFWLPGHSQSIGIAIKDVNGVIEYQCGGAYMGNIPLSYLPNSCSCTSTWSWAYLGSC